jgi:aryl-alcohol dehydrogenase-like predicted oxidoreductase
MHALHDVVKAGYVRYIGMSSCYAYQCERNIIQLGAFADTDACLLPSPCYAEYGLYILDSDRSGLPSNLDYAITNGLTPFISMQNQYSLVYREEEREMMPLLEVSDDPPYDP